MIQLIGQLAIGAGRAAEGAEEVVADAAVNVVALAGVATEEAQAQARAEAGEHVPQGLVLLQAAGAVAQQATAAERAAEAWNKSTNNKSTKKIREICF